jgi:hypothetical protein
MKEGKVDNQSIRKQTSCHFLFSYTTFVIAFMSNINLHSIDLRSYQHGTFFLPSVFVFHISPLHIKYTVHVFINDSIDLNLKKKNVSPKEGCWVFYL